MKILIKYEYYMLYKYYLCFVIYKINDNYKKIIYLNYTNLYNPIFV